MGSMHKNTLFKKISVRTPYNYSAVVCCCCFFFLLKLMMVGEVRVVGYQRNAVITGSSTASHHNAYMIMTLPIPKASLIPPLPTTTTHLAPHPTPSQYAFLPPLYPSFCCRK
jgi:hypothetical protein